MSKFWRAYASVSDDLRHHLVERAWFGRETTGNINEHDMPALKQPGQGPGVTNNFYGNSQQHVDNSVENFYGVNVTKNEADIDHFYGKAAPTPAAPSPAPDVQKPTIEEPKIEAPEIGPSEPEPDTPAPGY